MPTQFNQPSSASSGKSLPILGFVLSIISVGMLLIPIGGFVISLVSLIICIVAISKNQELRGLAIAGLVISIITLILSLIVGLILIIALFFAPLAINAISSGGIISVTEPFSTSNLSITQSEVSFNISTDSSENFLISRAVLEFESGITCDSVENLTINPMEEKRLIFANCQGMSSEEIVAASVRINYETESSDAEQSSFSTGFLTGKVQ